MSDETKKPKKDDAATESPNVVGSTFATYKAEFRKIVWPNRQALTKHTLTVIAVSAIFGAYIAINDGVFAFLLRNFIDFLR